jgi:hypothetical protein
MQEARGLQAWVHGALSFAHGEGLACPSKKCCFSVSKKTICPLFIRVNSRKLQYAAACAALSGSRKIINLFSCITFKSIL